MQSMYGHHRYDYVEGLPVIAREVFVFGRLVCTWALLRLALWHFLYRSSVVSGSSSSSCQVTAPCNATRGDRLLCIVLQCGRTKQLSGVVIYVLVFAVSAVAGVRRREWDAGGGYSRLIFGGGLSLVVRAYQYGMRYKNSLSVQIKTVKN